jgi:radical SAM superfamily enzyme YgiQ (UPF0313 family)
MNVLFVYSVDDILSPSKPLRSPDQMQFGISYISSLLKKHGHRSNLVVLSRMLGKANEKIIDNYIASFAPQLICFTAVYTEYRLIQKAAEYIKRRYPHIYLIAGGSHVSLNPGQCIVDDFDALCIGEGEYPVLELVVQLETSSRPSGIPNLWIKHGSEIERNAPRPFLQDIDGLPLPDRAMWQEWIEETPDSVTAVLLGRGCPFKCTYCCNAGLKNIANGPYVRFRSADSILTEIKSIVDQDHTKSNIYLEVETIGANKDWALELCAKLENFNATLNIPIAYSTNLRITPNLDLECLFNALKKSNFTMVKIGLESGSERVRSKILKRNYSNEDIIHAVSMAKQYGMKVFFYNLIGIPGETLDDYRETVKINRICLPDISILHIFFPYPGTEIYDLCKKQKLLPKIIDTYSERCKATLDLPGFSRRQIQNCYNWFDYDIYHGFKPIYKILFKVLVAKLISNTFLHGIYRKFTYSGLFKILRKAIRLT